MIPNQHRADFTALTDAECGDLAATLSETMRRLKSGLDNPPYNFILHSSPNLAAGSVAVQEIPRVQDAYHWHIEIIPRLSREAGFEWGTGFYINPTPPEEAAEGLRAVKLTGI